MAKYDFRKRGGHGGGGGRLWGAGGAAFDYRTHKTSRLGPE